MKGNAAPHGVVDFLRQLRLRQDACWKLLPQKLRLGACGTADPLCMLQGDKAAPVEPANMLWLIQRDFLEGKTVQAMVREALAPQDNALNDPDIAQVRLVVTVTCLRTERQKCPVPLPGRGRMAAIMLSWQPTQASVPSRRFCASAF